MCSFLCRDKGRREREREGGHHHQRNSDWDQETPRTDRRTTGGRGGGDTPYSKIKGPMDRSYSMI